MTEAFWWYSSTFRRLSVLSLCEITGDRKLFSCKLFYLFCFIRIFTCVYIWVRPRSSHDWKKRNGQDSDSFPSSWPQIVNLKHFSAFRWNHSSLEGKIGSNNMFRGWSRRKKAGLRSRKVAGAAHNRSLERSTLVQLVGPSTSGERKM